MKKEIRCFINKKRLSSEFSTNTVYIPYDNNTKFDSKDFHEGILIVDIPEYNIDKFMDGILEANSSDNDIRKLTVSVDFYEALKERVRDTFPPNVSLGENTLNIYGILIEKEGE